MGIVCAVGIALAFFAMLATLKPGPLAVAMSSAYPSTNFN